MEAMQVGGDHFTWLENECQMTAAWVCKQNELIQRTVDLSSDATVVRRSVAAYLNRDAIGVPLEASGRFFYTKRSALANQANLYAQDERGVERELLSPDAVTHDMFSSITLLDVSDDAKLFAYGVRLGGTDEMRVCVAETATGKMIGEVPHFEMESRATLSADSSGYCYLQRNNDNEWSLHLRQFSSSHTTRPIVEHARVPDSRCVCSQGSRDGRYYAIWTYPDGLKGAVNLQFADRATGFISPVVSCPDGLYGHFLRGTYYALTTRDAARGRIVAINPLAPTFDSWRAVVPEREIPIQGFAIVGGRIFVRYKGLASEIVVHTPEGEFLDKLDIPSDASVTTPVGTITGQYACYEVSSITHPPTIYRFHIPSRKQEVWHRSAPPFRFENINTERVWYQSLDGTRIPMTLSFSKETVVGPDTPIMLTAYGGFGMSEGSRFTSRSALWIEMGGVFAKANIRGGGEFGAEWHRAAVREKRQNAFNDFLAAADWLIASRYTTSARLAAVGGSNSGLLVGAALVQRPELFAAVVCFGPILDLLRYHLFSGSDVGLKEYGCADSPEDFEFLQRLSPYHNVKDGIGYPAVLFISGGKDTRCHPMHARKMCARLQEATSSGRPILIDYHEERGHAGLLPLHLRIDTLTRQFCFLLRELGLRIGSNGKMEPATPALASWCAAGAALPVKS